MRSLPNVTMRYCSPDTPHKLIFFQRCRSTCQVPPADCLLLQFPVSTVLCLHKKHICTLSKMLGVTGPFLESFSAPTLPSRSKGEQFEKSAPAWQPAIDGTEIAPVSLPYSNTLSTYSILSRWSQRQSLFAMLFASNSRFLSVDYCI